MKAFDWESLKMIETGNIPVAVWNRLIDITHSLTISNVSSGRTKSVYGVGTDIEIDFPGSGAAAAITFPWQFTPAPYTGGGSPPSDWGLNFLLSPGYVSNVIPSNMNTVFNPGANQTALEYWLHAVVSWAGGIPTITSLALESGASTPADDAGAQPTNVYKLLIDVTTNTTQVVSWNQYAKSVFALNFLVSNFDCNSRVSTASWQPGT